MFFVEQGRRRRRAGARQGGERRSAENRPQRYRFFNHKVVLVLFFLLALALAGCSKTSDEVTAPDVPQSKASTPGAPSGDSKPSEESPAQQAGAEVPDSDVVEISEKLFIAQTNDIYINAEDYLGKTIQYEGIFKSYYWEEADTTYYYVIRYGPGCCGYDGEAGFAVAWDGQWPGEDDWCEAVGILEAYEENGLQYLRLSLTSLTVKDERGAEYVST